MPTTVWILASIALFLTLIAFLLVLRKPKGGALIAAIGASLLSVLLALAATIFGAIGALSGSAGAAPPLIVAVVALVATLGVTLRVLLASRWH